MPTIRAVFLLSLFYILFAVADGAADNDKCCYIPTCPDYSTDKAWASRPAQPDKNVDVFYVYPTIYSKKHPKNMDVFDQKLRSDVQGLLKAQAGAFSPSANVFAQGSPVLLPNTAQS